MSATHHIPGIPFPLTASEDSTWTVDPSEKSVKVNAAPRSDIFVDPGSDGQVGAETLLNAATLLADLPDGDFQFSARVSVDFLAMFDAGVLLLWMDERHWAKLCFEYSPEGDPMVVSVVTREVSDDANSFTVDGGSVWLRVSRTDGVYAYHASNDAQAWRLVRIFVLDAPGSTAQIGFEAQSPTGDGCAVTFSQPNFSTQRLAHFRDGR